MSPAPQQIDPGLQLQRYAERLRIAGHRRRARSLRRTSAALRDGGIDLASLAEELADGRRQPSRLQSQLEGIAGIGPTTAARILELLGTGTIEVFEEAIVEQPAELDSLLELELGADATKILWQQCGITSAAALKRQVQSGDPGPLVSLSSDVVTQLLQALERERQFAGVPRRTALAVLEELTSLLSPLPGVVEVLPTGLLRRGRERMDAVDVLVISQDPEQLRDALRLLTAHASFESNEALELTSSASGLAAPARLHVASVEEAGAALLATTGPEEHVGWVEGSRADSTKPPEASDCAEIQERSLYTTAGLTWVPAELRSGSQPPQVPDGLLEPTDLCAELHAHTTASDGRHGIEELAQIALKRGLTTLAITDHSVSSSIAGGLTIAALLEHARSVRDVNERLEGIDLLAGAEVDILADGSLDYPDEVLAQLDIVVASPHSAFSQSASDATRRLVRTASHPLVDIVGHPTGRRLPHRDGLRVDLEELIRAAVRTATALEINSNLARLDLDTHATRKAAASDCLVSINCDVHSEVDFDDRPHGVLIARRARLLAEHCPNTWGPRQIRRWLARRRDAEVTSA